MWSARARDRMLLEALKIAPPALRRIIALHPRELVAGLRRGEGFEGQPQHRQESDLPGAGAAAALATVGRKAVDALDAHRPMKDVAYYLGLAAHFAVDLSDPTLTAPGGTGAPFTGDFSRYTDRNLEKFPVVFYGYPELPAARSLTDAPPPVESLEPAGRAEAAAARKYYPHIARAYARSGGSSSGFDVRSIPFGVASLCYSRGVTNIARAWLQIWISARGDLTGTPHLVRAGGPGSRADESAKSHPVAKVTESSNVSKD